MTDEHGEYSPLFEITPDRRPELFTKGNRKLLARLWNLEKDVYAKLKEQWRAQRMPGVPEIDKGVVADGKEMVRLMRENRKEKKVEKAQDSGVRIINVKQHMTNARLLLGEDRPTLLRSNGTWWDWNGSAYREIEEESIRAEVYSFVGSAVNEEGEPIDANAAMVTNIMDAMSSANFHARTELTSPCWMDPKPDDLNATECLALRNGILHVPTRTLLPPDPRFFTYNGLSYDYEEPWEKGQPKEWLKFLNSVWHDTPDQIDALQEVFGVLLLPITKYQKVFELFGPSRSGKGTILRTLTNVVGPANVTGATLDELTNQGFGLETLIGKSLMTVTDSRIAPGGGTAALIQNLLRISGEDTVSIKRKYKGNWEGTLGIRIMVAGNIPLTLPDQANALTARLFPMRMDKSFVGSEDLGLADRIARELPQILNWSLDGYDRLTARGKFVLTETGHEIIDEMEVSANPVKLFMRECCVVDARAESRTGAIFDAFDAWQTHNNINPPRLEQQFGRALFSASNYTVKKVRHRTGSEHSQEYYYVGLRLLPEWEEKARKHKQGEDV